MKTFDPSLPARSPERIVTFVAGLRSVSSVSPPAKPPYTCTFVFRLK
ncbi:MAG: hypothetical protein IPJ77_03625 [Planctomycetes bacterium]|nr:hypothetical protein [Planctomycetota bacterium]